MSVPPSWPAEPPTDATAPVTVLQHNLRNLRRSLPRQAVLVSVLCTVIALILAVLDRGGFLTKAVYSFAIGIICTALVAAVRLASATWIDRQRRRAGLPLLDDHDKRGWAGVLPAVLLALLAGPAMGLQVGDWLTGQRSPSLWDWSSTSSRLTLIFSVLATGVVVLVVSAQERLLAAQARAEAAQRQAAEHQLRLLQSQLEPHMLFNTLANLRVLVGLDSARAQQMLDHLIAYLRATLSASRQPLHPLASEFDRLADYLALMAVRMGPRLGVVLELPAELRDHPVPPLLLQPLVENAIQHGLEPQVAGGQVRVSATVQGPWLVLQVRDTGAGLGAAGAPPAAGAATGAAPGTPAARGFGLTQVRERLRTLHGDAATLVLEPAADGAPGTWATVRLPLGPARPPSPLQPTPS